MPTITASKLEETSDGRKVVRIRFTPQVPNPAAQSDVEAFFEVIKVDDLTLEGDPYAVIPLSCTQVETREPYTLSKDQKRVLILAALRTASEAKDLHW
jgi:hypothetical protein